MVQSSDALKKNLGFSPAPAGSKDITPYIKYDARSGTLCRVDKEFDGQRWVSNGTFIPHDEFAAVFDMENVETGWLNFAGKFPTAVLVRCEDLSAERLTMPPRPDDTHKNGMRVLIRLRNEIAGSSAVRELSSTADSFSRGLGNLLLEYLEALPRHPNMLPVVTMPQPPLPVKTGQGQKYSVNFEPKFVISGWVPRGDFEWKPHAGSIPSPNKKHNGAQASSQQAPQQAPQAAQQSTTPPWSTASFGAAPATG